MTKLYTESKLTGKEYCIDDCVRILNIRQVAFYSKEGIYPKDMYVSKDYQTGEEVLVFMFDRKESRSSYGKWLANRYAEENSNEE